MIAQYMQSDAWSTSQPPDRAFRARGHPSHLVTASLMMIRPFQALNTASGLLLALMLFGSVPPSQPPAPSVCIRTTRITSCSGASRPSSSPPGSTTAPCSIRISTTSGTSTSWPGRLNLTRTFSGTYCEVPGLVRHQGQHARPGRGRLLCPWARSRRPGAADGGNKFDLSNVGRPPISPAEGFSRRRASAASSSNWSCSARSTRTSCGTSAR